MRYSSVIVLTTSISSVIAFPHSPRQDPNTYTWDPNGNLNIIFSQATVQIGTVSLDEMFAKLDQACHEAGQCETNDIEFDGQIWAAGRDTTVSAIKVTLGPDGAYPTWIRNGLLDSLKAAVRATAVCKDVTRKSACPNPMAYCNQDPQTSTMCEVPAYWGVNFQDKAATSSAPPHMSADVAMEFVDNTICQATLTGASAVAGAINGAFGGVFTLLSLFCDPNIAGK